MATPRPRAAHERVLAQVAERLAAPAGDGPAHSPRSLPSRDAVLAAVEGLRQVLFPGYFGAADLEGASVRDWLGVTLGRVHLLLEEQVARAVAFVDGHDGATCVHCRERGAQAALATIERLPELRRVLATDVEAAFAGDPALKVKEEAIFSYPGVHAITEQRIAHVLHQLDVPLIPRIISEHAHSVTGIDIHPGARIGEAFFIDHGTGVVIGETARIGDRVRIYQGVTLGAKSFPLDATGRPIKGIDRHPILEDDVVIYSGATVLGRIVIGAGSSIGGNVWLTHAVPPGSRVTQAEAREQRFELGAGI
jgi:serine O-acetyltransferase